MCEYLSGKKEKKKKKHHQKFQLEMVKIIPKISNSGVPNALKVF